MTAICVLRDDHFAYLVTDGAAYDVRTGVVKMLLSKAVMFADARMVLAVTGRFGPQDLIEALDAVHDQQVMPSQESLLSAVKPALRRLHDDRENDANQHGNLGGAVIAALYDTNAARPRILLMHTHDFPGGNDADAWRWQEEPVGLVMPTLPVATMANIFPAGCLVNPRTEMARVLQAQRCVTHGATVDCGVGGPCLYYRVGPGGIDYDEVMRFPEAIGEKLDASRPGRFIASRLDKEKSV